MHRKKRSLASDIFKQHRICDEFVRVSLSTDLLCTGSSSPFRESSSEAWITKMTGLAADMQLSRRYLSLQRTMLQ
jgi:hypothetical protein